MRFPVWALSGLLLACNQRPVSSGSAHPQLQSLEWLQGKWRMTAAGRPLEPGKLQVEEWRRLNDSTFGGRSYLLAAGSTDTTFFESIQLREGAGGLQYVVQLSDQNGGQPVIFNRADTGSAVYTFVNPKHDFPQRLSYRPVSADSAMATVEGTSPYGSDRKIEIGLRRMP